MFTNPHASAQIASDRQRELLADAEQRRLTTQFRDRPRAPRQLARARQGLLGALRRIPVRRTEMPA